MTKNESGVREQLVRWVESDEPPFHLDVERIRSQARRSRHRTRAHVAVATVAAAAAAIVAVISLVPRSGPELSRQAQEATDFDPVHYAQQLKLLARGAGWAVVGERSSVEALDGRGNPIRGQYRSNATQWHGRFEGSSGSVLDFLTGHYQDADRLAPESVLSFEQGECEWRLEQRQADVCEVEPSADGAVIVYSERAARQFDGFWLFIDPDRTQEPPRWRIQRLSVRFTDGLSVTITEAVPTGEPSARSFLLDRDRLTALARQPSLRFPRPPQNDQNCEWVPGSDNPADWC